MSWVGYWDWEEIKIFLGREVGLDKSWEEMELEWLFGWEIGEIWVGFVSKISDKLGLEFEFSRFYGVGGE